MEKSSLEKKTLNSGIIGKFRTVKSFFQSEEGKIISTLAGIPFVGGAITGYAHSKGIVLNEMDPKMAGLMMGTAFGGTYAFIIACNRDEAESIKDTCLGAGAVGFVGGTIGALGYGAGYSIGKYLL